MSHKMIPMFSSEEAQRVTELVGSVEIQTYELSFLYRYFSDRHPYLSQTEIWEVTWSSSIVLGAYGRLTRFGTMKPYHEAIFNSLGLTAGLYEEFIQNFADRWVAGEKL